MSLYTKYGDKGFTYTKLSAKTPKNHALVNFLGNLDELNCFLGYLFAKINSNDVLPIGLLEKIMAKCFEIGAFLGYNTNLCFDKMDAFILEIEKTIDQMECENSELKNFILPTGTPNSGLAHMCRAIARRVERSMYDMEIHAENEVVIKFLNRLSDFLFSLARTINRVEGGKEIIWQAEK